MGTGTRGSTWASKRSFSSLGAPGEQSRSRFMLEGLNPGYPGGVGLFNLLLTASNTAGAGGTELRPPCTTTAPRATSSPCLNSSRDRDTPLSSIDNPFHEGIFLEALSAHPVPFHGGDGRDPTVPHPSSTRATWAQSAAMGVKDPQLGEGNEELPNANHLGLIVLAPTLISV